MNSGFTIEGTVQKVEASYSGYGDARRLKGAVVTVEYSVNAMDYETKVEIPQTSVDTYPTVGDTVEVSIG